MKRTFAIVAVLLVLGACGVQSDSGPHPLASADVPFDLLAPATSVGAAQAGEDDVTGTVWLVDNDGLLARGSRRPVEPPVTVEKIVTALLQPVTDAEANAGLKSNIFSGTRLLGIDGPTDGLVTLDLSGEFLTVSRELQRLALAQVTFTVTGLPNVDRVLFKFDGNPAEVPGRGDELTAEPLTRADFEQFDPAAVTTTIKP